MSKEDEILDDLLATQLYEPMEIPESPEFLQPFGAEESTEIKDKEPPENKIPEGEKISEGQTSEGKTSEGKISEGTVSEGQISEGKTSKGKIAEGTVSESQTSEDKTSKGKISEGITSEGKISEDKIFDDMMETQAYGLDTLPQDEHEDMATQAYGLMFDADSADTGDELEATQAYGDDIEVPKMRDIFKVPGAMNTQELNEDGSIGGRDETAAHNEKVGNEDYDDGTFLHIIIFLSNVGIF
jgi:hypothetical protein